MSTVRLSARAHVCRIAALSGILVLTLAGMDAAAQTPAPAGIGVIEGRVVDAATGTPLPGATVVVSGTASQTSSDRDGVFRLVAVPAGNQAVVVTYLGRKDEVLDVKVTAGAPAHLDVKMASVKFEESVTVQGDTLILESPGTRLERAEDGAQHLQCRRRRSDWIVPRSQCRRDHVAHSRGVDHQRSG